MNNSTHSFRRGLDLYDVSAIVGENLGAKGGLDQLNSVSVRLAPITSVPGCGPLTARTRDRSNTLSPFSAPSRVASGSGLDVEKHLEMLWREDAGFTLPRAVIGGAISVHLCKARVLGAVCFNNNIFIAV